MVCLAEDDFNTCNGYNASNDRPVPFSRRMMSTEMIITIDGPAGAGKSTAARDLAQRLNSEYLDTGAMYRAVAWACLDRHVDLTDEAGVTAVARSLTVRFDGQSVLSDGRDVTVAIRTAEVSEAASIVAAIPSVRQEMVRLQRAAAADSHVVSEGRDQGTVVFPGADCKFFVTADAEKRAVRRHAEIAAGGLNITLAEVLSQIIERDRRDRTRKTAPLVTPDDAVEIDTSSQCPDEVLDLLERVARRKLNLTDPSGDAPR